MIEWILHELEKQPGRLFYRQELERPDNPEFDRLRQEKMLSFVQPDEFNPVYGLGCRVPLTVVHLGAQYWGISEDDPEAEPALLSRSDLGRYKFMVDHFAARLIEANELAGSSFSLDDRQFYLGERMAARQRVAFVFGLFNSDCQAQNLLLSLPGKLETKFDFIIVITPSYTITSAILKFQLERMQIYVVPLKATRNFVVDVAAIVKTGRSLTVEQERDYEVYQYKCRLPVYVTGEVTDRGNYIVRVGETAVEIGEVPFRLFLRLALELKRNKTGVVSKVILKAEGYLNEDSEFQAVGRLRSCFVRALGELDPNSFIEAYQPKTLRISVHPDLIDWNREKLSDQGNTRVRDLVDELTAFG